MCSSGVLKDESNLTIGMPKNHGDFLVTLGPMEGQAFPTYVVYPKPRWPLKLTAGAFRRLSALTMKVRDITGIYLAVERAFVLTGTYRVVVEAASEVGGNFLRDRVGSSASTRPELDAVYEFRPVQFATGLERGHCAIQRLPFAREPFAGCKRV